MDVIVWSRIQFAMTAAYHWLFVPLTLGLALVMAVMETLYVIRKDELDRKSTRLNSSHITRSRMPSSA